MNKEENNSIFKRYVNRRLSRPDPGNINYNIIWWGDDPSGDSGGDNQFQSHVHHTRREMNDMVGAGEIVKIYTYTLRRNYQDINLDIYKTAWQHYRKSKIDRTYIPVDVTFEHTGQNIKLFEALVGPSTGQTTMTLKDLAEWGRAVSSNYHEFEDMEWGLFERDLKNFLEHKKSNL